ncbi:MAG TPA: AAA family ATPase [Treponema sp.]|nr:MAG: AAA family ATPase [Treponema sp. GWC1_61_84]OHE75559.1 MAG: AAA family ATPase [Treponema sp. RIFOXYC1_FULL_61_9]HCM25479.1 AAA family ATPase [Treponema sp.]
MHPVVKLDFEKELNDEQIKAVKTIEGPVLIIAGAGSGKTRVITFRMAYMLDRGIPQSAILALTFTNKAAREMEERVKELTRRKLKNLTVSTFHAFGVKVLREDIERLGYRKNFSIYDETDRNQLIKDSVRECGLSTENLDLYKVGQLFSNVKIGRYSWGDGANDAYERVYAEYQSCLKIYNAVDFDDLLTLPIQLFEEHPEVLARYRERYKYLMVDEFQDTSTTQYRIMRLLADRNVCVVGDDDQSIYSWRGASFENITNYEKDFPGLVEIKLEQNYRSTSTILEAANGVIANNTNRKDKVLWSGNEGGKPIEVFHPENESAEADFIAEQIKTIMMKEDLKYDDFGVLIRANSMTRHLEEAFLAANIPYRISGGTSFFQRKEIKDVISYLRVIANPDDDVNLLRIVNTPRRGLGKTSIEHITEAGKRRRCSVYEAMTGLRYAPDTLFPEKGRIDVDAFLTLIEYFRAEILGKKGLSKKVRALVDNIDYWSYLVTEYQKSEKAARWKFMNIESLINSIETWEKDPDNFDPTLFPWLNRISLITRDDGDDKANKGKVNLMTIHASKGLEFPVVFIAGAEVGLIPHARSLEEGDGNVEEERRLFYVAITRARDKLFITSCKKRRKMQSIVDCSPSPFLAEIPPHLVEYHDEDAVVETADEAKDYFAKIKGKFA